MSVKFRFSCGMALLVSTRCYWHIGRTAQESIDEAAEAEQVFQRADERKVLRRDGGRVEVRPLGGDQRLTPVRQNEDELQAGRHARLSEHLQGLPLEWVMWAGDSHSLREVLMVGSVW
jgi:hypothetical protein